MDAPKTINLIDGISSIIFLSLMILQQLTGKTNEQVLEDIKVAGAKTDELLKQLR